MILQRINLEREEEKRVSSLGKSWDVVLMITMEITNQRTWILPPLLPLVRFYSGLLSNQQPLLTGNWNFNTGSNGGGMRS